LTAPLELGAELRAAAAVARKELRVLRRYPLQSLNVVLQPLYQFLLPSLLLGSTFLVGGRASGFQASAGTADLAGFLFLGAFMGGLIAAGFWSAGFAFRLEMLAGTLEPAWLTPTRRGTFVLGYSLSGLLIAVVGGSVLLGLGTAVFQARFLGAVATALPALVLAEVGLLGVTFGVSACVLLMKEPNFFVDSTNFVFSAVSGIAFPIGVLPGAVKVVSLLLPTTYALDLLRVSALGTRPLAPAWLEYAAMAGLAILLLWLGSYGFGRAERRLQQTGSLSQH
jgi:ABC-2 type transport system permease protein